MIMGTVTAIIGFLITYANLTIYVGVSARTGLPLGYDGREIFMTICAALGGPLAAMIAVLQFPFIGFYLSLPATGIAVIMLDRFAASLVVVFLYRFMYVRIKKIPLFLLFWAAAIWAYYVISLNIEIILGCILSGTSILATYHGKVFAVLIRPFTHLEPSLTYFFTSLAFLAIPAHFRKPLWEQPQKPIAGKKELMMEDRREKAV
jgi:hypothetical protein